MPVALADVCTHHRFVPGGLDWKPVSSIPNSRLPTPPPLVAGPIYHGRAQGGEGHVLWAGLMMIRGRAKSQPLPHARGGTVGFEALAGPDGTTRLCMCVW